MSAIVVIPARGGSKGVPRKNLARIGGLSLVGRSVLQGLAFAERAGLAPESVVVDTDSEEIAAEGRRWGAYVPFLRPADLALDTTRTIDSVLHMVGRIEERGRAFTEVVLLQPTSPLRIVDDIVAAWTVRVGGAESVITVKDMGHPLELAIRVGDGNRLDWVVKDRPANLRRQDLTPAFFPNGAVYVCSLAFLRHEGEFVKAHKTHCVTMPGWRSIDIDTPDDIPPADALVWRTPLDAAHTDSAARVLVDAGAPEAERRAAAAAGSSEVAVRIGENGGLAGPAPSGARVVLLSETPSYDSMAQARRACVQADSQVVAVAARVPRDDVAKAAEFLESLAAMRARFGVQVGPWIADAGTGSMVLAPVDAAHSTAFDVVVR